MDAGAWLGLITIRLQTGCKRGHARDELPASFTVLRLSCAPGECQHCAREEAGLHQRGAAGGARCAVSSSSRRSTSASPDGERGRAAGLQLHRGDLWRRRQLVHARHTRRAQQAPSPARSRQRLALCAQPTGVAGARAAGLWPCTARTTAGAQQQCGTAAAACVRACWSHWYRPLPHAGDQHSRPCRPRCRRPAGDVVRLCATQHLGPTTACDPADPASATAATASAAAATASGSGRLYRVLHAGQRRRRPRQRQPPVLWPPQLCRRRAPHPHQQQQGQGPQRAQQRRDRRHLARARAGPRARTRRGSLRAAGRRGASGVQRPHRPHAGPLIIP